MGQKTCDCGARRRRSALFSFTKTGFGIGIDEKWKLWEMMTFSHGEREIFYTVRIEKVEKPKIV